LDADRGSRDSWDCNAYVLYAALQILTSLVPQNRLSVNTISPLS
jgi:hypothetical protein